MIKCQSCGKKAKENDTCPYCGAYNKDERPSNAFVVAENNETFGLNKTNNKTQLNPKASTQTIDPTTLKCLIFGGLSLFGLFSIATFFLCLYQYRKYKTEKGNHSTLTIAGLIMGVIGLIGSIFTTIPNIIEIVLKILTSVS